MKVFFIFLAIISLDTIVTENPYRVLGVAPYQRLSKIRKIYKDHIKRLNESDRDDYRRRTDRFKKAYEEIKSSRKVEHEEIEDNILSGLIHLLEQCFISVCLSWIFITALFKLLYFSKHFLVKNKEIILASIVLYNIYDNFLYHILMHETVHVTFSFMLILLSLKLITEHRPKLFKSNVKKIKG
jgi:hypothetical protein